MECTHRGHWHCDSMPTICCDTSRLVVSLRYIEPIEETDDHSSSRVSQRASSIANNIIRERFLYSSSTARLSNMQMFQTRFGKVWSWENDTAFVKSMRQGQMYEESTFAEHLAPIVANASVMLEIGAHIYWLPVPHERALLNRPAHNPFYRISFYFYLVLSE